MVAPSQGTDRRAWLLGILATLRVPALVVDVLGLSMVVLLFAGAGAEVYCRIAAPVVVIASAAMAAWSRTESPSGINALFQGVPGRLMVAVTGMMNPSIANSSLPIWSLGVFALGIVAGPFLGRLAAISHPAATGLDGVARHRGNLINPWASVWANIGGMAFLALGTWVPAFAPASWACLAAGLVSVAALASAALGVLIRHRQESALPGALRKLAPRFVLYWVAEPDSSYQVAMWLPVLDRVGVPYFVIVRTRSNFEEAAALTKAPVVLARFREDLDNLVVPSLRSAFYVNNSVRNLHMTRFPTLSHIQLNHGDSDKSVSSSPIFRMYDRNFVAGQAAIDGFAAAGVVVDPEAFVIVGRPQLEEVDVETMPMSDKKRPRVLYAPTWFGTFDDSRYSSLVAGPELVASLVERGCDVIFRPHPRARSTPSLAVAASQIETLLGQDRRPGAAHVYGRRAEVEWSVFDCFNHADALVSDISSVANDFLFSMKPFALMAVSRGPQGFEEEFPIARAAYVIDASAGRLAGTAEQLDAMLGPDPLRDERARLKTYYLGDSPPGRCAEQFLDALRRFTS